MLDVTVEHAVCEAALAHAEPLIRGARIGSADPLYAVLPGQMRLARGRLNVTYTVRLYIEFEFALRDYWTSSVRVTQPNMVTLVDSIAARRNVPPDWLADTHEVRRLRNDIVHAARQPRQMTIAQANKRLGRYLSMLPVSW